VLWTLARPRWSKTPRASRPSASELLKTPGALLTRSDLRKLGLQRRAVDAVFRECPVIMLPGYSRPMVQREAYLALLAGSTYSDACGQRVRPERQSRARFPQKRLDGADATATARTRPDLLGGLIMRPTLPRPDDG
jgi:hypothetical protein